MGEKLLRKREGAIEALLEESTLSKAARRVGVSERTLRSWLKRPEFSADYREARRQIVENSITKLQQATGEAVDTLRRNLNCGNASVETRAAMAVLDQSVKAIELMDMEQRISEIEAQINRQGAAPWPSVAG